MEKKGRYGEFGGQYAAETLMNALINLEEAFNKYKDDEDFNRELNYYHKQYTGRPSILYYAEKMTKDFGKYYGLFSYTYRCCAYRRFHMLVQRKIFGIVF